MQRIQTPDFWVDFSFYEIARNFLREIRLRKNIIIQPELILQGERKGKSNCRHEKEFENDRKYSKKIIFFAIPLFLGKTCFSSCTILRILCMVHLMRVEEEYRS